MNRQERIEEIFAQALKLGSPAERQQYLDTACRDDPALRREINSLLQASDRAGDFLANPTAKTEQHIE